MDTITPMESLLTQLGQVFTAVVTTHIPSVVSAIIGSPLLLLGTGMLFTGFIIGIFRRLLVSA